VIVLTGHARRIWNSITDYLFVVPTLVFIIGFMIYPVIYNMSLSMTDLNVMNFRSGGSWVGVENYRALLSDATFRAAFGNTLVFVLACLACQFTIGFALAILFNNKFPGSNTMRAILMISWMLPKVVVGTLFQWILNGDFGLLNQLLKSLGLISKNILWLSNPDLALWGVILANVWIGIPFNMIILIGGLQTLSEEIFEAARIDGAGAWDTFTRITLPLMRPTIMILLILGFIYTSKVFDLIHVMTQGGPLNSTQILPYYSYILSFQQLNFGKGSAVSGVIFLFLIIVSVAYLRESQKEEVL
jgi:multiple sugar transport system permease protein